MVKFLAERTQHWDVSLPSLTTVAYCFVALKELDRNKLYGYAAHLNDIQLAEWLEMKGLNFEVGAGSWLTSLTQRVCHSQVLI